MIAEPFAIVSTMQRTDYRPIQLLAALALCALAASGCCRTYAYRARVIGGPVQPMPAVPLTPTPAIPHAAPGPLQPLPATPQPLVPTPQPAAPYPHAANAPPATPPLVSSGLVLEKVGPAQATLGALVNYRIEVQAASGGARGVVVSDQLTSGLRYESSTPAAAIAGTHLEWRLGDLRGGELRTIEVNFRAEQAGMFNNCAVARTVEGQTSQDCASTAVLVPELDVRVSIVGSDTVMVGDRVTFQVSVTNRGNLPATGLVITDSFDAGLEHEASASPIEKDLGQLAGGESQTIGVTFRAREPGRLCNRVEVRGEAGVRGAAEACVTVMMGAPPVGQTPQTPGEPPTASSPPVSPPMAEPPQAQPPARSAVQVKVSSAAATQTIDAVAQFSIDVTNSGEQPLSNIVVTVKSDASLNPVEATGGYEWDDRENLTWKIPSLAAGKSTRLQLNCRCQRAAQRACISATVTSQDKTVAEDEACLEIRKAESRLLMKVADFADPISVDGPSMRYEVQITNTGAAADTNVALLVVVPPEMMVNEVGTMGPGPRVIEGQNVRFKPVAELPPGETLTFKVNVKPRKAGDVKLEARLKSDGLPEMLIVNEETKINAPRE
jgi:uncharacterized repeat protein (TIGR01451 family)